MESAFHTDMKELFCALCTALLLLATVTSAEESAQVKNPQCQSYAGGHVYPGEAFRVPVSDHSLHLSKAKSEFLSCFHPESAARLAFAYLKCALIYLFIYFCCFLLPVKLRLAACACWCSRLVLHRAPMLWFNFAVIVKIPRWYLYLKFKPNLNSRGFVGHVILWKSWHEHLSPPLWHMTVCGAVPMLFNTGLIT